MPPRGVTVAVPSLLPKQEAGVVVTVDALGPEVLLTGTVKELVQPFESVSVRVYELAQRPLAEAAVAPVLQAYV